MVEPLSTLGEQVGGVVHLKWCLAVFGLAGGRFDHTSQLLHHQLHPVANPQHGDAQIPDLGVTQGRVLRVDGAGTTAKDDSLGSDPSQLLRRRAVTEHHRKHLGLPHTAGDQLGILRAEIKDDDGRVTLTVGGELGHQSGNVSRCDNLNPSA